MVASVRKSGLTIAVEAASETLRQVINKPISNDDLFAALRAAYAAGFQKVKLYFMVGFPGETEEDFQATADLIRRVRYKNCFVFKYSPRPGTHAEKALADDVPAEVKQERNVKLLEIISEVAEEDNKKFLGRTLEVLVEGPSKKPHLNKAEHEDNPQLIGRTAHDYIVVFNGPERLTGEFVKVNVTKTAALTLFAELSE
jgi:tRNA-2-methylthio-N6-dimethylallyladenosine synthase